MDTAVWIILTLLASGVSLWGLNKLFDIPTLNPSLPWREIVAAQYRLADSGERTTSLGENGSSLGDSTMTLAEAQKLIAEWDAERYRELQPTTPPARDEEYWASMRKIREEAFERLRMRESEERARAQQRERKERARRNSYFRY